MTWLAGSSPNFPSNLGMSEGSLVGILGHVGSCNIGSFMSLLNLGMLRDAIYGMGGLVVFHFSLEKKFSPRLPFKER